MTSEKSPTPWGERILQLLAGRPVAWLARESGLGARNMSDIINKTTPGADRAVRIAQALGTTVEYLMTGEGGPPRALPGLAEPVIEFRQPSDLATRSVSDRYREALLAYEEATQAAAVLPDEGLKEVLISLLFRHGVPVEDIVLILAAKAQKTA